MALEREEGILGGHAAAVVRDADQGATARGGLDRDQAAARVEGVIDQLLDHRGRPLDHLTGGDLIDHCGR
jgi:hypothetical protein